MGLRLFFSNAKDAKDCGRFVRHRTALARLWRNYIDRWEFYEASMLHKAESAKKKLKVNLNFPLHCATQIWYNICMHEKYEQANLLSREAIAAAMEVHSYFGSGLLESIYVKSLARELKLRGHKVLQEVPCKINYKGLEFEETLRCDLLVDDCLIIEAKAVESCDLQRYRMQLLSYLKLLDKPLGLVINFGDPSLTNRSIRRVILKGAAD